MSTTRRPLTVTPITFQENGVNCIRLIAEGHPGFQFWFETLDDLDQTLIVAERHRGLPKKWADLAMAEAWDFMDELAAAGAWQEPPPSQHNDQRVPHPVVYSPLSSAAGGFMLLGLCAASWLSAVWLGVTLLDYLELRR